MHESSSVSIDWADLSRLHVVRRLRDLLAQRFGVELVFVDAAGTSVAGASHMPVHAEAPILLGNERIGAVCAVGNTAPRELDYVHDLLVAAADEVATYLQPAAAHDASDDLPQEARWAYDTIIGRSRPMQDLYRLLDKIARSEATVLIQGDNGTGKELIARAIHYNSRRSHERFVVQNCSAFNDNLLDSELFGHKKGAFTGAIADKQGLFEVADGGTFFLDEIGDMSAALQVKLLRVLQEGTFIPVGDTEPRHVNVRIIAATNRDLRRMVERGEFREDLYYRINVINLTAPALRERKDDIPLLVEHFLKKHAPGRNEQPKRLTRSCLERLTAYPWPGNVRELENEIERLNVLAGDEMTIGDEMLSTRIQQTSTVDALPKGSLANSLPEAVRTLERGMILETLRRVGWNKTRASRELRISRRNLIRKVQKYRLASERRKGHTA